MQWVSELFPTARSYLDVYDRDGLIGPRAVLAHGIWLDERDRAVLRERGRRSRTAPRPICFWAVACSTGPKRSATP